MKFLLVASCGLLVSPAIAGDRGITPTEIRVGGSVALSGPLGPQTSEYVAGARSFFDNLNKNGGVHGRKIRYLTVDDGFDIQKSVSNTRQLIDSNDVFLVFMNSGTAQTLAILPLAEQSKTIVFGPITGASVLRRKYNRYLFNVRASYADEARYMLAQIKEVGLKRVALLYQDDSAGKALLSAVKSAAAAASVTIDVEVEIDLKQQNFDQAAELLRAGSPQAVIMCAAGTTFPKFVKAVLAKGDRPVFYGFSVAGLDVINQELGRDARGIILAQVMPSLKNAAVPIVTQYLAQTGDAKSAGRCPARC